MSLQASIFDLDGTLLNSEPLWRRAEIEIYGTVGVPLTEAMCRETTGMSVAAVTRHWHARYPWKQPTCEVIESMLIQATAELIAAEATPLPGALAAIAAAKAAGLGLALATASPAQIMTCALARLGLENAFDALRSSEDAREGKPHPEIYLNAASALGVEPSCCVAFEDSIPGMLAARSAGMRVVMVPASELRQEPRLALADEVLDSLEVVTTSWFARLDKRMFL